MGKLLSGRSFEIDAHRKPAPSVETSPA